MKKVICKSCDYVVWSQPININNDKNIVNICPRCLAKFHSYVNNWGEVSFVFSFSSLILFLSFLIVPFISMSKLGFYSTIKILDILKIMLVPNYWPISIVMLFFVILIPLFLLLIIIFVNLSLSFKCNNKLVRYCLIVYKNIFSWNMIDVFLISVLVSLIKLVSLVDIIYEIGFWIFIFFIFNFIISIHFFNSSACWQIINPKIRKNFSELKVGRRAYPQGFCYCPSCQNISYCKNTLECEYCGYVFKNNNSILNCFVFVLSAIFLYIPANVLPMMEVVNFGNSIKTNILDGVIVLWNMKSYFVASVIFFASICIPMFKIIVLLYFCIFFKQIKKIKHKRILTVLYKIVEFIGKWSMIDVFVVSILSAIVKMQNITTILPGSALLSFCAVVLLTTIAAKQLSSNLIWNGYK